MKHLVQTLVMSLMLGLSGIAWADLATAPAGKYALEKTHAYISFSYSHLGFSNPHLGFNAFDVELDLDNENPTNSQLSVEITAASIDSRLEEFNEHLNGPDFFDTAKYPEIAFTSKEIKSTGDNTFDITGDLVMKGQAHPVTFAATINKVGKNPFKGLDMIGVSAEAKILRSQWGLGKYAPGVSDEVTITVDVEMMHQE